jgi:uncharacterized repeat protein (TIGR02543 family)
MTGIQKTASLVLASALLAVSFVFPPATSALTGSGGEEINLNAAVYELAGGNISFPDVRDDAWDIKWLAKNGVVSGYPDGTFKPLGAVTRAEFAKMLCVAMGLLPVAGDLPDYTVPVPEEETAENAVSVVFVGGEKTETQHVGYGKTVSKPADPTRKGCKFVGWYEDKNLTRLYSFGSKVTGDLILYAKFEGNGMSGGFEDLAGYTWAEGYIDALAEKGIINGVSATKFNPSGGVTYDEAIKMLVLAMGYSEKEADARGGYPKGYRAISNANGICDIPDYAFGTGAARIDVATLIYNTSILPPPVILPFGDDGNGAGSEWDRWIRDEQSSVGILFPLPSTAKVYYTTDETAPTTKSSFLGNKTSFGLSADGTTISLVAVNKKGKKGPVCVYRYSGEKTRVPVRITTEKIENAIPDILAEIFEGKEENLDEKEKAELIFAWVAENAKTDDGRAALIWGSKDIDLGNSDKDLTFCVRHAEAFADLMRAAGAKTEIVVGYASEYALSSGVSHAWNAAKVNGVWYHFDAGRGVFGLSRRSLEMKGYVFSGVFSDIITPFAEDTDLRI